MYRAMKTIRHVRKNCGFPLNGLRKAKTPILSPTTLSFLETTEYDIRRFAATIGLSTPPFHRQIDLFPKPKGPVAMREEERKEKSKILEKIFLNVLGFTEESLKNFVINVRFERLKNRQKNIFFP